MIVFVKTLSACSWWSFFHCENEACYNNTHVDVLFSIFSSILASPGFKVLEGVESSFNGYIVLLLSYNKKLFGAHSRIDIGVLHLTQL